MGCSKRFRTMLYLATKNGGTDANSCLTNTWSSFSGPADVCAWNEMAKAYSRKLYYYQNHTGDGVTSAANLLDGANGQCHAWADLFKECLLVNNVGNVKKTRITPPAGYTGFGVKNIDFDDLNPVWPEEETWKYGITSHDGDGREIDDLDIRASGIAGQNMTTPYANLFTQHFLVHRTGDATYYDPSYGITTTGADDYTSIAINAWQDWVNEAWHWRKVSSAPALDVMFSDENW